MNRIIRTVTVFTVIALLTGIISGCGQNTAIQSGFPSSESEKDDSWTVATGEPVVISNGKISFELDSTTTHFKISDLTSGVEYFSVPNGVTAAGLGDVEKRMKSEVTVTYYEEQSNATYMFSDENCTAFGNQKVTYNNNKVRVYYKMSLSKETVFVPQVLDTKAFEKTILGSADDPNIARRLRRYYTLYDPKDKSDDFKKQAEVYPILNKQPLYILNDSLNDIEKEEVSSYMDDAGYTAEPYTAMLEELGIEHSDSDTGAGFCIPVEYTVNDDGFSASVLADGITEASSKFKLQTVTLLEYFASCGADTAGYYVVPDGSGALINIDSAGSSDFKQKFYGEDESVQKTTQNQITKNLTLPIFGISYENGGILAIVEKAAEVGTLNVSTIHNSSPQNHIYTDFTVRHMDATDIGEMMNVPVYNLFSKHIIQVPPTIRYVLLGADKSDYASMAAFYRSYLHEKNGIVENEAGKQPVYLNYLCSLKKDASFIGIPYQKKIVLSTISEIISSVKKLKESGVETICVRLLGYTKDGLEHGVYNSFGLDRKIGTKSQLIELKKLLEDNGGCLYLDADFEYVYSDKFADGFSAKDDSAHFLNRSLVRCGNYDVVTRDYDVLSIKKYFVSPSCYEKYASGFIDSLKKKLGCSTGLSYASAGQFLGGDYTVKKDYDRTMSAYLLDKTLKSMKDKTTAMMFENGNAYVLPYAAAIMNVPMFSSQFDLETEDVPFYQMVTHGSLSYAGTPQNLSDNPVKNYLRTAEYGGALCYTLITGENSLLTNTDYEYMLYSLSDRDVLDEIISKHRQIEQLCNTISGAVMTENREVAPQVYKTVYDNGHGVYVNYGNSDVIVEGLAVSALSFKAF